MPGVLIVEAMAQLGGLLLSQKLEHTGKLAVLLSMDKVKMRHPVVPGDQLILEAVAVRVKSRTGHVRCKAFVQDKMACEADIKFMLVDAEPVRVASCGRHDRAVDVRRFEEASGAHGRSDDGRIDRRRVEMNGTRRSGRTSAPGTVPGPHRPRTTPAKRRAWFRYLFNFRFFSRRAPQDLPAGGRRPQGGDRRGRGDRPVLRRRARGEDRGRLQAAQQRHHRRPARPSAGTTSSSPTR